MTSKCATKAFPLAFPTIATTKHSITTQRKKGERRKERRKKRKENRNESEMVGPSSLLTSYKLFLLFLHKQNTSFHTLGAHALIGFKSPRSAINTNQNKKQHPTTRCAIKSSNAKHN